MPYGRRTGRDLPFGDADDGHFSQLTCSIGGAHCHVSSDHLPRHLAEIVTPIPPSTCPIRLSPTSWDRLVFGDPYYRRLFLPDVDNDHNPSRCEQIQRAGHAGSFNRIQRPRQWPRRGVHPFPFSVLRFEIFDAPNRFAQRSAASASRSAAPNLRVAMGHPHRRHGGQLLILGCSAWLRFSGSVASPVSMNPHPCLASIRTRRSGCPCVHSRRRARRSTNAASRRSSRLQLSGPRSISSRFRQSARRAEPPGQTGGFSPDPSHPDGSVVAAVVSASVSDRSSAADR
jgi:hypothetical protein